MSNNWYLKNSFLGRLIKLTFLKIKKLEKILKVRFSNNWDSVRKAFLGLDTDYDGYITVEDILRYFG